MTLNTNIIPLTSIFHNLVSDSLNIQNCQILDSEPQPRWNDIKHRPTTHTLITIPTTRLSYDFPTFFLSNTRLMANKLDEISVTITNNKCDIAIITESRLSSNITNDLIKIPGFSCIRKDRCDDQRGGGLCTYIRNTLDFLELKDLSHPDIESQWFLIKPKRLPRGIDAIVIASVYHPPQNNDLTLRNHLFESLDNALTNFPNAGIVLLGDFNQFKPGSLTSSFNLKQVVKRPTRGKNILDKIYTTLSKHYIDAIILPCIGQSDHQSVLLNPTKQSPKSHKSHTSSYITKRDCRPENKQALITTLSQINRNPLYNVTALEDQFNLFSNKISSVIDSHTPLHTIKCYPKDKPWITADIKKFISKRQKAWSTSNIIMYNFYRNKVRKLCKSARQSYYDKKILNTRESNPKKWYDNIKSISGLSKSEPFSSIFHDGEFKRGPELAELIAESFCAVSNGLAPLSFNKLHITSVPDEYIMSTQQVETELEKISSSPISLTPVLSKLLESFVFRWLFNYIKPSIDPLQFGNIKNCSTTHALIHMIHNWLADLENPGSTIRCCMIDFSKAFDRIDHNILLHKLQQLNIPPILLNWCAEFLHDRYLRVKLGQNISSWRQINAGVPQGTKLGHLFFLVMINDLQINTPLYKYVDDCSTYEIVSRSFPNSSLQANINIINDWTNHNNMRLNVSKTKEMRISFLSVPMEFDALSSSGLNIEIVQTFKLLGVIISSDLTWNAHIDYICTKASKRLYALRILKRSGAPANEIITVFCAFIRPVLEYASPVWHFSLPQFLADQIESIQKRALKIAFPQSSYAASLRNVGLLTLYQRRENQCLSFYKNIHQHPDDKLRTLLPSAISHKFSLRNKRTYPMYKCKTERYKNSFIPSIGYKPKKEVVS